jgi:hypothetical protein
MQLDRSFLESLSLVRVTMKSRKGVDTRPKLNVQINCSRADLLTHCEHTYNECQDNFLRSMAAFPCLNLFCTINLSCFLKKSVAIMDINGLMCHCFPRDVGHTKYK